MDRAYSMSILKIALKNHTGFENYLEELATTLYDAKQKAAWLAVNNIIETFNNQNALAPKTIVKVIKKRRY